MPNFLSELLIIIGLILLNAFFSAAEIAIISLRHSRTKELLKLKLKRAIIIDKLQKDPEKFIATTQVGITLIGTITSAFGGAQMVDDLAPSIRSIPISFIQNHADSIAFVVVVILIAYISLVLGELVPKSLALRFAERIALAVSYPINFFSKVFFIFIKFLTFSSNLILKPFKDKTNFSETKLSEQEIRSLIEEGREAGTIEKREHEFLENVFDFGDMEIAKIMIPRTKATAFDISNPAEEIMDIILESGHSRIPVYKDEFDNIIGIIYSKDVMEKLVKKEKIEIETLMRPALFVPSTQSLHDVLQKFKKEKTHMALVLDEHGDIAGLVTLEDILEELVGEISDESDIDEQEIIELDDGSFLVDGSTSLNDFNRVTNSKLPENASYNSISGFLLTLIRRFPRKGEKIRYKNLEFQIKEKNNRRIRTVLIKKVRGKSK